MDTEPRSAILSADTQLPTTDDLSNWLILSEWKEQSSDDEHMSNINFTQLLDSAVAELDPTEARFENVESNSCQTIPVSESDDFDSVEILTCDGIPTDDEEKPLELELSLLDDDSDIFNHEKNAHSLSLSTMEVSPLPASSNLDKNNNLSCINQKLNHSDDRKFCLEDDEKSDARIQVQSKQRVSTNPKGIVYWEGQGFSCAHPSKKKLDGSPYFTKANLNGNSNSFENNANLNSNTLATNSKSSDDKNFSRDRTVNENVNEKMVRSEFLHKSKVESTHFSPTICSELSEICKDCNDNIIDVNSGNEVLSLEPPDDKESVEKPVYYVKSDLSDSQLELKTNLNENSMWDRLSDQSSFDVSQSQDGSSSICHLESMDQNQQSIQNDNSHSSCSLLKSRNSLFFSPARDFETRVKRNKRCKLMPETLIIKTTFDGDRIKVLSDETGTSPHQNHISPGVKSQPTDREEELKQKLQNEIHSEPGKCSSQCEDSMIIRDHKDQSKPDNTTVFKSEETSFELSWDSQTTKPYSKCIVEQSTQQPLIKNDGRSLINSGNIPKVNPKNLLENSNPELISLTCHGTVPLTSDSQLTDCHNKIIQKIHPSVKKSLKYNLEGKSSKVYHQLRNSNNEAASITSGPSSKILNKSQQHSEENCTKDMKKEPDRSLGSNSESSRSKNLRNQKVKKESSIVISVNNKSKKKRTVKMRKRSKKGGNSSIAQQNRQISSKFTLNNDKQSVTGKNKLSQELQIEANKDSENLVPNRRLAGRKTPGKKTPGKKTPGKKTPGKKTPGKKTPGKKTPGKKTPGKKTTGKKFGSELGNILPKSSVQLGNTPRSVKKRKKSKSKSKSKKKRAKALISMSKMGNLSAQTIMNTVNTQFVPSNFRTPTCCATSSKNTAETSSSSSSLWEQTHPRDNVMVTAEDPTDVRKFVKAKRVLDKQKQLSTLLEDEDCLDESEINDRVQWVCRRWKLETLSNQDINLTTAAYIRRQLPTQEAACFQGRLEGQKDCTLAIIAPNRKRKLYQDDDVDDDSKDAHNPLGHASKRRRLSQNVQLIPDKAKDLQPDIKLFGKQLIENLAESQNMSLAALKLQRNEELNVLDKQFRYLRCQLQEKQFQEQQYYGWYRYVSGYVSMYQLQSEHDYQHWHLDLTMQKKYNDLGRNFAKEEERIRSQYKTNVEKIKTILSEGSTDSDCMTVALRKAPNRTNKYKATYQTVSLTPHVAMAMVREDEIYDSFYSHKV